MGKEFSCALTKIPFTKENAGEDYRTVRHIVYSEFKKCLDLKDVIHIVQSVQAQWPPKNLSLIYQSEY